MSKGSKVNARYVGAGLIVACIVVVGAFILLQAFTSREGSTEIIFNASSELPDPMAGPKHGRIEGEGVNVLEVGKTYEVVFSVTSRHRNPAYYTVRIDSSLKSDEWSFTLAPGESKSSKIILSPMEEDKWVFSHKRVNSSKVSYGLTDSSWLGERIEGSAEYAAPSLSVGGFRNVLNLDISLMDLTEEPYRREYTSANVGDSVKVMSTGWVDLSVTDMKLTVESSNVDEVYVSEPQLFTVSVGKRGSEERESIFFWYRIK